MSEEPGVTTPESGASAEPAPAGSAPAGSAPAEGAGTQAAGEAEEPIPPSRWSRVLPRWVRRRPRIAAVTAGVLAAAVIAAIVYAVTQPSAPRPAYASLPKQSCALVSSAELAKYLPGATGMPLSVDTGNNTTKNDVCKWFSTTGGEDRTLVAQAIIFRSSSAISQAQQSYRGLVSFLECHCPGVTVSTQPVTGLGDQATEVFVVAGPDAKADTSSNADSPGASLLVRSSNAVISLNLNTTAAATGASRSSPPGSAQSAGMISLARGILAVLARPASISSASIAHVSAEPHYAGPADPCRLIGQATLARYAPGAAVTPTSSPGTSPSSCAWESDGARILLNLTTFPSPLGAQQRYSLEAGALSRSVSGLTVTGAQVLDDLGEGATAAFQRRDEDNAVEVLVWSGNADLDVIYTGLASAGSAKPDRATLTTGAIAMARDGLAALANPSVSSYPQGPHYARPSDPCRLVRASTLASYAPGASVEQLPAASGTNLSNCAWGAQSGNLFLSVTTYSDTDSAQGGLEFDIQFAHKNPGDQAFKGSQPVRGLGEQAIAIFETTMGNSPGVDLYVWSGNVVVEMSYSDVPFGGPPLSRAGKLAADIAMARDVLAGLRHA